MKKWYHLLFAVALALLLGACPNTAGGQGEGSAPHPDPAPAPGEGTSYTDVVRRPAASYTGIPFGFSKDDFLLILSCPSEWTLQRVDGGYLILRDGAIIGQIGQEEAADGDAWETVVTDETASDTLSVTKSVQYAGAGEDYRFRYEYAYRGKDGQRTLSLIVALCEVDEVGEGKLFSGAVLLENATSETVGALSERVGDAPSILILGNSFVGSSNIAYVLSEMMALNGKDGQVLGIPRGYATVATYIRDAATMESIRKEEYDVVFICGFYSADEVGNLGVLKSVCDESQTELVVFPAHNENETHIEAARNAYPSLLCLHWKGELDGLIAGGVDRWDLCMNDSYNHSTELAGYVGAHMIYRALFGELPQAPMRYALAQQDIDAILSDYAYVGDYQYFVGKEDILYLD